MKQNILARYFKYFFVFLFFLIAFQACQKSATSPQVTGHRQESVTVDDPNVHSLIRVTAPVSEENKNQTSLLKKIFTGFAAPAPTQTTYSMQLAIVKNGKAIFPWVPIYNVNVDEFYIEITQSQINGINFCDNSGNISVKLLGENIMFNAYNFTGLGIDLSAINTEIVIPLSKMQKQNSVSLKDLVSRVALATKDTSLNINTFISRLYPNLNTALFGNKTTKAPSCKSSCWSDAGGAEFKEGAFNFNAQNSNVINTDQCKSNYNIACAGLFDKLNNLTLVKSQSPFKGKFDPNNPQDLTQLDSFCTQIKSLSTTCGEFNENSNLKPLIVNQGLAACSALASWKASIPTETEACKQSKATLAQAKSNFTQALNTSKPDKHSLITSLNSLVSSCQDAYTKYTEKMPNSPNDLVDQNNVISCLALNQENKLVDLFDKILTGASVKDSDNKDAGPINYGWCMNVLNTCFINEPTMNSDACTRNPIFHDEGQLNFLLNKDGESANYVAHYKENLAAKCKELQTPYSTWVNGLQTALKNYQDASQACKTSCTTECSEKYTEDAVTEPKVKLPLANSPSGTPITNPISGLSKNKSYNYTIDSDGIKISATTDTLINLYVVRSADRATMKGLGYLTTNKVPTEGAQKTDVLCSTKFSEPGKGCVNFPDAKFFQTPGNYLFYFSDSNTPEPVNIEPVSFYVYGVNQQTSGGNGSGSQPTPTPVTVIKQGTTPSGVISYIIKTDGITFSANKSIRFKIKFTGTITFIGIVEITVNPNKLQSEDAPAVTPTGICQLKFADAPNLTTNFCIKNSPASIQAGNYDLSISEDEGENFTPIKDASFQIPK